MASVTKFTAGAVYNQLRHNLRQIAHSSNPDIDPVRLRQDYVLSPDRGANDVLDRRELRNFHPDLQRYLDEHGLEDAHVMTGVTRAQGGNRTVAELKAEREQEYEQETERPELDFGGPRVEQELHF